MRQFQTMWKATPKQTNKHSNGNSIVNVRLPGRPNELYLQQCLEDISKKTGSVKEPFAATPLPQRLCFAQVLCQCMSPGQSRKLPWPRQFNLCEGLIEGWKDRSVKECKGILDFGRSWQGPSDFFSCNPLKISGPG